MSDFSQFFGTTSAGGSTSGMNIYSNIKPPKFSAVGNLQNINAVDGKTDSFLIPSIRDRVLALNVLTAGNGNGDITTATWDTNVLIWDITNTNLGVGASINGFAYNHILDKYYFTCSGSATTANNGLFEINISTGAKTKLSNTLPEFMSAAGLSAGSYLSYPAHEASSAYVDSDGNYIWRVGDLYKKFNTDFTAIQTRSLNAGYTNRAEWYYTADMTTRVRYTDKYRGAVNANTAEVQGSEQYLVIERGKQRRMISISSREVFSAGYRDDYHPAAATTLPVYPNNPLQLHVRSKAPMCPTMVTAPFFGDSLRLGLGTRNESVAMGDAFLVDRIDYDRWITDVADATGMRDSVEVYYGGWVNV